MTPTSNRPHLTDQSCRESFNLALQIAAERGVWPTPAHYLGTEVFDAVGKVADSYPNADPVLVERARRTFETYLDRRREIYG